METTIRESLETSVLGSFDVCVIGGSCTGVFAAIRAAQAGATVALVEAQGLFGGVATAGMVNIWHSLYDTEEKRPVIAGLTSEMIERLKLRDAMSRETRTYTIFNPAGMTIELDRMVVENPRIRPFLHTRFVKPLVDGDGRITHAVIEDKSGRRAIAAKAFIDASGDGDLIHRAGLPTWKGPSLQPPTTGAVIAGLDAVAAANPGFDLSHALDEKYGGGFNHSFLWSDEFPGFPNMRFLAASRVNGADCSDADSLTKAEIEGRRQIGAIFDIVRKNFKDGGKLRLSFLPATTGIRETRHCEALHRLTEMEVLEGVRFDDAIANGSYRVDIHGGAGIVFKYLDGTTLEQAVSASTGRVEWMKGRWREERTDSPAFYQIPYRSLVPKGSVNAICAGRMIDADAAAFGAVRVMVNCNQMGEAAGFAAAMSANDKTPISKINVATLRSRLAEAGALIV